MISNLYNININLWTLISQIFNVQYFINVQYFNIF